MNRRSFLAASASAAALGACGAKPGSEPSTQSGAFPRGFLWGASTAGHQIEGANTQSDCWYLENLPGSAFAEPSGDAVNGFNLWAEDLDLVKSLGLNTYRFSLEWSRIEPVEGQFSAEAIAHYHAIITGCRTRGLTPIVTINHFTAPLWFSADGGWTNPKSPKRFEAFSARVAPELAGDIGYAITMNEPQLLPLLGRVGLPDFVIAKQIATLETAERELGVPRFAALNLARPEDVGIMQNHLLEGHAACRNAFKSARADLPVGVSIAMFDDVEMESDSQIDEVRLELYDHWLKAARDDDFIGVQNYERKRWTKTGALPPEDGLPVNFNGSEVYAPSLAGAVSHAHKATGRPVLVTEHGVGTDDDTIRQTLITDGLAHLKTAMDDGVPVLGYCHWSLLDNFEWVFGYRPKFGLVAVDRTTFVRTPKPSASIYGAIARANAI